MKFKKSLIMILIFISLLILIACNNQEAVEQKADSTIESDNLNNQELEIKAQVNFQAPDFTLINLAGNEISLSDYREDKVVFLNFWASWCPPCKIEMPAMQKIYQERSDEVKILAVNVRESQRDIVDFIEKEGYKFTVLLDGRGEVSNTYLVRGIPKTLIIDRNGIITREHIGALTKEQMNELIDEALSR